MIGLADLQRIIADGFLNGDMMIAGLIMFSTVLAILFIIFKANVFTALLMSLPVTLVFSLMGVLSGDMTILMIIVAVLGLAINTTSIFEGKGKKG